ncbi:MAG: hypothetical protein LBL74_02840 [Bacteroidales bacterium]|jgi:chromosome segregation ATPase|nr:hypothetical protein [Bacteroidales bacterium]
MDKVDQLIAAIDYKSKKVLYDYANIRNRNAELQETIFHLEKRIEELTNDKKYLENKIREINIGKISHSEIAECKTKINELVRKIDRCITIIMSDEH